MLLPGTEMHLVTFVFVIAEIVLFTLQFAFYLSRPKEKSRQWYLILLSLLLTYNISSGMFPDPRISIPVVIQNIIAYGSGFVTAAFFPYYFYKAFDLRQLRFHAIYGIHIFLLVPYLLFFVVIYSITENLNWARKYGLIIPFIYAISLLGGMTRAIYEKYKKTRLADAKEIIGVYLAVAPWVALPLVVYLESGQVIEVSLTNGGFLVITVLYIRSLIRRDRVEIAELVELKKSSERTRQLELLYKKNMEGISHQVAQRLEEAVKIYNLTPREKDIISRIYEGKKYTDIARELFISEKTVAKHSENIFRKTGVSNKIELIKKLNLA